MRKYIVALCVFLPGINHGMRIENSANSAGAALTPDSITVQDLTVTGTDGSAFTVGTSTLAVVGGQVGIGTASPATVLDVNGAAQFGSSATKSTVTATGLWNGVAGTEAAPSLSFGDGPDMGLYRVNASRMGITVAGTKRVQLNYDSVPVMMDVEGSAQFGSGATKSTFTATGFWEPYSRTKAQIDTLVPTKVGQVIYASDTTLPGLCVSTGTAAAQWRKMESATLGCGTNN